MGAYTIAQAEAHLAQLTGLSDVQRRQYQAEVQAARTAAEQLGADEATKVTDAVRAERDDLYEELCEVRDALAAAKANGDRSVLADLRHRHQTAVARIEEIERLAEHVESIEADPVAYGESIFNKYPRTRPTFTF